MLHESGVVQPSYSRVSRQGRQAVQAVAGYTGGGIMARAVMMVVIRSLAIRRTEARSSFRAPVAHAF